MDKISQNKQLDLLQTKKTVDWLVNNTSVNVFNPINFTGYQRQIDNKHCSKIADYLKQDFFFLQLLFVPQIKNIQKIQVG